MANISTKYMGLELKSPIIVGSCGLSDSIENLMKIEAAGAGAVVLKSVFEEQINFALPQSRGFVSKYTHSYPDSDNYVRAFDKDHNMDTYISFLKEAKSKLSIPIIASVNCISASEWIEFSKRIEEAGADALELNIFVLPSDPDRYPEENEDVYFDVANEVKRAVKIPISLKISPYFSSLAHTIKKLSWTGVSGIVLFNRFYNPDINIDNQEFIFASPYSNPEDLYVPLKWVAILSDAVDCDIAASTGIHDGAAVIKQLLAGAKVVQVVSTLYKNGIPYIAEMQKDLETWMEKNKYEKIEDFRGKLSFRRSENVASWERIQFMQKFYGMI